MALTTESIDARSRKLMDEFVEHWEEIKTHHPEMTDKLLVFTLWQNQKIAGLQEICLELAKQLRYLADLVLDEIGPIYDDLIASAVSEQTESTDAAWIASLAGEV